MPSRILQASFSFFLLLLLLLPSIIAKQKLKVIEDLQDERGMVESERPKKQNFDVQKLLSARPASAPITFDCKMRELAFQFAEQITSHPLSVIFDGLQLSTLCNQTMESVKGKDTEKKREERLRARREKYKSRGIRIPELFPKQQDSTGAKTPWFVDTNKGNDSNPGSFALPFKTVKRALMASRSNAGPDVIILRGGTYYFEDTLTLGPQDQNLIITNFNEEEVYISGGRLLSGLNWKPYNVSSKPFLQTFNGANNVYARAVSRANTDTIKYLGTFDDLTTCQSACASAQSKYSFPCRSYTYHTKQLGGDFAGQCFAVTNEIWGPVSQKYVISGRYVQPNIYVADLSGYPEITSIPGLQTINGSGRKIRARYPDGHPETTFFPAGWIPSAKSWIPPANFPPATTIVVDQPQRTDITMFQQYSIGIGGSCSIFTPPESYWCSAYNSGGGASVFHTPRGLSIDPTTVFGPSIKNLAGSTVHAWHPEHWALWMYEVDQYDPSTYTMSWTRGGFQGARGSADQNRGGEFYIENAFELLDSPDEYYFDEKTKSLYLFFNGTGAPPPTLQLDAANLKVMVEVTGTKDMPVTNLTIQGLKFVNAAATFMDPHGVPSGGDWAMQRSGALVFEGTENLLIINCTFKRLDGNGVFLSGYHRSASIIDSEFAWIGESPVVLWGNTDGIDGTGGDQPRSTLIVGNLFREVGHFEKQSSPFFQAKSCQTLIYHNIMFNGPRALINFNDGFGGANEILENLLFNANRETSDQGPFNSWDRMPFLTDVVDGTPSLTPAYNDIHHNFFICNYGSNMCIDNDDGSSYYLNHDNFEVYGGHKSDFGGHNKFTFNTIQAYAQDYQEGLCGDFNDVVPGYVDGFYNNTCIQGVVVPYVTLDCDPNKPDASKLPVLSNNKVYNPQKALSIQCGNKVFTEQQWQAMGFDKGTTVYPMPSDDEIISWAKTLLNM